MFPLKGLRRECREFTPIESKSKHSNSIVFPLKFLWIHVKWVILYHDCLENIDLCWQKMGKNCAQTNKSFNYFICKQQRVTICRIFWNEI